MNKQSWLLNLSLLKTHPAFRAVFLARFISIVSLGLLGVAVPVQIQMMTHSTWQVGQSVTLTREGIVVDGAGKTITFRNAPEARFEMDLEVTGQVKDLCDSGGTTMSAMRLAYNGHRHRENGQGSNTDKPDKAMEA